MKVKGVIYILTNPSFPQYVKIGYAQDLETRMKQLNRSATLPFAFRAYAIYEVENALTDRKLHELIDNINPTLRARETFCGKKRVKEFYAMQAEDAYRLLECIAKISGTESRLKRVKPEGHEIEDEKQAEEDIETMRRGVFRFSMCGIKPGEKVAFVKDASKQAEVVDDRHVRYGKETMSLSMLAKQLTGLKHELQGPIYFTYKGELLDDLRKRLEQG